MENILDSEFFEIEKVKLGAELEMNSYRISVQVTSFQ